MRLGAHLLVPVGLLLAALVILGGHASAHLSPCHLVHSCPSDHHSYTWNGLSCTSYADERLPADTRVVAYAGRTYWCSSTGARGSTAGGSCGVERWSVKTLSDSAAASVSFQPRPATVDALVHLRRSGSLAGERDRPVELTTYVVRARLVELKAEHDSDIHLVIADPAHPGETMIVEFPSPGCTTGASPAAREAMASARAALVAACGPAGESFRSLSGTATITGVGFFDFFHNQTGVAPNVIELHPVLGFASSSCG